MVRLQLNVNDPGAGDAVYTAVAFLLTRSGDPRLTIEPSGETLPAALVASLIAGLRRVREVAGAIAIDRRTSALRNAMTLHGLDRVFAVPLDPTVALRSVRYVWHRCIAAIAAIAFCCSLLRSTPRRASADPVITTPSDSCALATIANVIERNPGLASYQGRLHVDVKMVSFPFLRQHFDGTSYYKRPSNYEVVFDRVPSYAKGFDKLYADIGDPSNWQSRFLIKDASDAMFFYNGGSITIVAAVREPRRLSAARIAAC